MSQKRADLLKIRVYVAMEGIMNSAIFEPADNMTVAHIRNNASKYMSRLKQSGEITEYKLNIEIVGTILTGSVSFKLPNLVETIIISINGDSPTANFNRAMRGI